MNISVLDIFGVLRAVVLMLGSVLLVLCADVDTNADADALHAIDGVHASRLVVGFVDSGELVGVNGDERKVLKLAHMMHSVYIVVADDLGGCQEAMRRKRRTCSYAPEGVVQCCGCVAR